MFVDFKEFEEATRRRYDWARAYTAQEYLGLLPTHSNHQMLPPAQLARLLTSIAELIRCSGDRIELLYETHLYLGKRIPFASN